MFLKAAIKNNFLFPSACVQAGYEFFIRSYTFSESTASATSCTRIIEAPPMTAIRSAAIVPASLPLASFPVTCPIQDFLDNAIRTGYCPPQSYPQSFMSLKFPSAFFPNPIPGSIHILSFFILYFKA